MLFMKNYISGTRAILNFYGISINNYTHSSELRGWLTCILSMGILLQNSVYCIRGGMDAEVSEMVSAFTPALFGGAAIVKVFLLQYKWKYSYEELLQFVDGWYMMDYPICRKFKFLYESSLYSAVTLCIWYALLPVISWEMVLPLKPYDPLWDVSNSVAGYAVAFALQMMTMFLIMSMLVVGDYTLFMCCIGFRNHLVEIREGFEKLKHDSDIEILLSSVKKHQTILRKLRVLAIPCGPLFFIQVLTTFIGACFMLFSAIKEGVESVTAFIRLFVCALSVYFQLLLYCWVVQNITNASDSLQFAIYNNNWYECSPKIRENFHMVETFTSRSLEIQSSFVVKMSLKTFHRVLTESYSFLMVLVRMTNNTGLKGNRS